MARRIWGVLREMGSDYTMRMTLAKWAEKNFEEESKPCKQTLWKMARRGDIPGAYQDRADRWWVNIGDNRTQRIQTGIEQLVQGDKELQELFS